MSLRDIVSALGGDLYADGRRASVPAPGHSAADRSVSLLVSGGRLIIHGFGAADWREARDMLLRLGFIDREGRLTGGGSMDAAVLRPDTRRRRAVAAALWAGGKPLSGDCLATRHLRTRAVFAVRDIQSLAFHPEAPVSVYRETSTLRPALMARILDPGDDPVGVELTYLEANGLRAVGLRLPRKTIGAAPTGSAIRLHPAAEEMLAGEGVFTTLSASRRFQTPGWSLMSSGNMANWAPPPGVRSVLVAGDRGKAGEAASARLKARLEAGGLKARILLPDPPFGDWNEVAVAEMLGREREGR